MPKPEPVARESEADFQARIVKAAKAAGWLVYHTHDSRRSEAGFPDLVLLRCDQVLYAEVKSATGALTEAQVRWLNALGGAGQEIRIWTPGLSGMIEQDLGLGEGTLTDTAPNRVATPAGTRPESTTFAQEARDAGHGPLAARRIAEAQQKGR